jgi:hypothetical protein
VQHNTWKKPYRWDGFLLLRYLQYLRVMIKFFLLNLLLILCAPAFAQENKIIHRLLVHPSSSVSINGKSNVNKYECGVKEYKESDTLYLTAERGKGAYFKKGLARLDAAAFVCSMDVITKDFAEMIEAEKYPYIKIDFISFERVPKYEETEEKFKGDLTITLGKVAVRREVRCGIVKDDHDLIHLRGKQTFKFSDFGLEAPTKMMGLVKVDEKITVTFHLVLSKL